MSATESTVVRPPATESSWVPLFRLAAVTAIASR
jgi:hypothetical protein